jgi:hypothetical protein
MNRPTLWTDGRGFVRYGKAKLPVRVVGGVLEFIVKEQECIPIYGRRVLIEVEELASLCSQRVTTLDSGG